MIASTNYGWSNALQKKDDIYFLSSDLREVAAVLGSHVYNARRLHKKCDGKHIIWPKELEICIIEGIPYMICCHIDLADHYFAALMAFRQRIQSIRGKFLGKSLGRNQYISQYIHIRTGSQRTRTQVGSRLQQIGDYTKAEPNKQIRERSMASSCLYSGEPLKLMWYMLCSSRIVIAKSNVHIHSIFSFLFIQRILPLQLLAIVLFVRVINNISL